MNKLIRGCDEDGIIFYINRDYGRISNNRKFNSIGDPYDFEYVSNLIKYFESIEEYEKCAILFDYMNNIEEDHDKNYTL